MHAREGFDPRFLFEVLRCNRQWLLENVDSASHGTGRLNTEVLLSLPFDAPELDEQRHIAASASIFDAKIALNRRTAATLEALARRVFRAWFVDFDPVKAHAAGEEPHGLPPEVAGLFPDRSEETEIGPAPAGWAVVPLSEVCEARKGLSYKGAGLTEEGGRPLHNLNSVFEGGGYKHAGLKRYTGGFKPRHLVRPGDALVTNTEQGHDRLLIGYAAIVPGLYGDDGLFSHHLYRVRPRPDAGVTGEFLVHLLNDRRMQQTVSGYANGTTVNMLPPRRPRTPPLRAAPARTDRPLHDPRAARIRARREALETEKTTLAATRDRLLPKLISGELRVANPSDVAGSETHD